MRGPEAGDRVLGLRGHRGHPGQPGGRHLGGELGRGAGGGHGGGEGGQQVRLETGGHAGETWT